MKGGVDDIPLSMTLISKKILMEATSKVTLGITSVLTFT